MSHSSVNRVAILKATIPSALKENTLEARLSRTVNLLSENNFPELSFFVHNDIDAKPTIVLVGKYESSQDIGLFTLLNSKEFKNILPENIVVEWMHGDEQFPNQTILEKYPYNP